MKVALITYQVAHLKTKQVVDEFLKMNLEVVILAFPFYKKAKKNNPLSVFTWNDRPSQLIGKTWEEIYGNRIEIEYFNSWEEGVSEKLDALRVDVYLHCVAKILSKQFISNRIILNTHPGMLPDNRGVDALKFSIVKKMPIAITLHAINEEIDSGKILARIKVPVFLDDSLQDVFLRSYETEVLLFKNFQLFLPNLGRNYQVDSAYEVSHSRICHEDEHRLDEIFELEKSLFVELSKKTGQSIEGLDCSHEDLIK